MTEKIFASAISTNSDWKKVTLTLSNQILKGLKGKPCHLLMFFVSQMHKNFNPEVFSELLKQEIPCQLAIGCNSSGVIGVSQEVEMEPAISILAMHLPNVRLSSFYLSSDDVNSMENGNQLLTKLDVYPPDKPKFICLADPASCDVSRLLHAFNDGYKNLPVIGGLASGAVLGVPNWLSLNGQIYWDGAVGVSFSGDLEFETVVSQGCRPIGKSFVITKADGNALYELAGRPALEVTKETLEALSPQDKKLSENSLFIGLAMNEQKTSFKRGDFLVRNIIGFDPDQGTLMIGAYPKVGQTLQFQLRDKFTSEEDMRFLLERLGDQKNGSSHGAFLVSCAGRGKNLFGKPDHDVSLIQSMCGPLALAGFFANGEIGPIDHKNFVHGYTSSLVILK